MQFPQLLIAVCSFVVLPLTSIAQEAPTEPEQVVVTDAGVSLGHEELKVIVNTMQLY